MRQPGLVEDDGRGLRSHFSGEGQRVGFLRQLFTARADHLELVVVAGAGARDEDFPVADTPPPHRMPPRVPEIEVADHADPPRVRRQHDEGDALDPVQGHRMRAEPVVEPLKFAFAEQIEIVVAEDRRKAIGILEIDDGVAETGAQLITARSVGERARKQTGFMESRQRGHTTMLVDRRDLRSFGKKGADHRRFRLRRGGRDSGRDRHDGLR